MKVSAKKKLESGDFASNLARLAKAGFVSTTPTCLGEVRQQS